MTHSLHRCGELQENDYVWLLYHVNGVNDKNLKERLFSAVEIAESAGAINWGDVKSGPIVCTPVEKIRSNLTEKSRIRGVFSSKEQTVKFLKQMKAADLGLCVIIAGPLSSSLDAGNQAELTPHTINYSVGIFGKKELIAEDDTLAVTTMCGHHMVPDKVVEKMRKRIQKGKIVPEKAGLKLAQMCPCGIFNQQRAADLLRLQAEAAEEK